MKRLDLTGQIFGRLTAIKIHHIGSKYRVFWLCKCECGNEVIVVTSNLRSGHTLSCGCLLKEAIEKPNSLVKKTGKRFHRIWLKINERILMPYCKQYSYYGGRGITMSDKWLTFQGFYDDMYEGYQDNLTIDRIDVNKGYYKENCRWVTMKKQSNNRRSNHLVTYNDETLSLTEMAEKYNISPKVLNNRINKLKWDIEKAITTPLRKVKKRKG